jgi:hypothetical protein
MNNKRAVILELNGKSAKSNAYIPEFKMKPDTKSGSIRG